MGLSIQQALYNSYVHAIESESHILVENYVSVHNDKLIEADILTHQASYVVDSNIISEIQSNNKYVVTAKVELDDHKILKNIYSYNNRNTGVCNFNGAAIAAETVSTEQAHIMRVYKRSYEKDILNSFPKNVWVRRMFSLDVTGVYKNSSGGYSVDFTIKPPAHINIKDYSNSYYDNLTKDLVFKEELLDSQDQLIASEEYVVHLSLKDLMYNYNPTLPLAPISPILMSKVSKVKLEWE